ncbi:MAG: hypothetical protein U0270_07180 [Labilithrix sp.]
MTRFGPLVPIIVGVMAGLLACQEPDPSFGDPNGIWGKTLPGEKKTASADPTSVPAPTITMVEKHGSEKGKAAGAPLDKVGDCMACHTGTPGPKFSFGGRVENAGTGVPDVVVTVTDIAPVKTDKDGYFWQTTGEVAQGGKAQVQKGTDPVATMTSQLGAGAAGGGCLAGGTCHGGTTGPIHP